MTFACSDLSFFTEENMRQKSEATQLFLSFIIIRGLLHEASFFKFATVWFRETVMTSLVIYSAMLCTMVDKQQVTSLNRDWSRFGLHLASK